MSSTRPRSDENGSGSGSGFSDLSALENDTDTLGRAILRHERDARRIQAVLHGSSRPFSRALPRPSLSQRLQRSNIKERDSAEEIDRRPLAEKRTVDTSLNTTRTWGRRQRPERQWTHHDKNVPRDGSDKYSRRQSSSTEKEEDEDAIVPHKTAFTGDEYLNRSERFAVALAEDTPPSMKRNRPPSEPSSMRHMNSSVMEDEYDERYQGEISPIRQIGRTTLNPISSAPHYQSSTSTFSQPAVRSSYANSLPYRQVSDDEDKENNLALPNKPESSLNRPFRTRDIHLNGLTSNTHTRSDSLQLLERLAKVSSKSPSPAKATVSPARIRGAQTAGSPSQNMRTATNPSSRQNIQVEEVLATPIITGGWIDTPKQDTKDRQPHETKDILQRVGQDRALVPREVPTSQSNTTKVDAQNPAPQRIISEKPQPNEVEHDTRTTTKRRVSLTGKVHSPSGTRQSQSISRIKQEHQSTQRGDVNTGSTSRAANSATTTVQQQHLRPTTSSVERAPKRVTFDLNRRTVCEHCGGGYANIWEALWIELRSNLYIRNPASFASVQLTWLGAALLAWMCWYTLENLLCKWYCKPSFALSMDDYGANILAPKYPLVIPTLLLRPFDSLWRPIANWVAWLSGVTFHWIFGEGARDYTIPAQLSQRTYLPNKFEDRTVYHAARSLRPSRLTETATALVMTSSRRAIASVVDAIDELGRAWDGEGWG